MYASSYCYGLFKQTYGSTLDVGVYCEIPDRHFDPFASFVLSLFFIFGFFVIIASIYRQRQMNKLRKRIDKRERRERRRSSLVSSSNANSKKGRGKANSLVEMEDASDVHR